MSGLFNAVLGGKGFTPLAVAASNVSRTIRDTNESGDVTTVALPNTTITGGVAPHTQEWTNVSGSGGIPTISSSTSLNPTWTATVVSGVPNVSVWRCTVTDAVSATAFTDITVTLTWTQT